MKKLIIALAALAASAGVAQARETETAATATPAQDAAKPEKDPDEVLCRNVQQSGTRLGRKRDCRTREEWEQSERRVRRDASSAQQ
jgi:hypothetical protein